MLTLNRVQLVRKKLRTNFLSEIVLCLIANSNLGSIADMSAILTKGGVVAELGIKFRVRPQSSIGKPIRLFHVDAPPSAPRAL
jgi:hypothetical protein